MSGTARLVSPPYDTPVGRFVRLRAWAPGRAASVAAACDEAARRGFRVLDVASATPQPIDPAEIGRWQPTGGCIVELRVADSTR